jgi:hypothetical protein
LSGNDRRRGTFLVFSEVGRPDEPDGFALSHWVRRERPVIKVVLTAGSDRTAHAAGDLCEQGPMLAKPYDHAELARLIRSFTAH